MISVVWDLTLYQLKIIKYGRRRIYPKITSMHKRKSDSSLRGYTRFRGMSCGMSNKVESSSATAQDTSKYLISKNTIKNHVSGPNLDVGQPKTNDSPFGVFYLKITQKERVQEIPNLIVYSSRLQVEHFSMWLIIRK